MSEGKIKYCNVNLNQSCQSCVEQRRMPCPTCKEMDQLTPEEFKQGRQCPTCKHALELGYGW